MSDIPAPPPGFELEASGAPRAAQPEPAAAAAPAVPAPPEGFEIEKGPAETFTRGTILPIEKSDTTGKVRLAMPQIGKDLIDAISLPGRAVKGEDVTMDELINAAGFVTPGVAGVRGSKVLKDVSQGPRIAGKQFGESAAVPKPVARAIRSDGLLPEQVAGKVAELGPEGVLADLGPNLQAQAGAVATTPGAGQKTVVDAMTARRAGAPERLRTELDTTLGPAPVPSEVDAGLKAGQKALSPEYDLVLKGGGTSNNRAVMGSDIGQPGPTVDTNAIAKSLDEAIPTLRGDAQTAVANVRKMLNKTGDAPAADPASIIAAEADPAKRRALVQRHLAGEALTPTTPLETDPGVLLETRRAIGGMLDTTKDGNTRRVLTQAKQDVDSLLATAVPGIKEIDAKHGSLAQARTNLETGQTALDSGRESLRPSEMRAKMAEANTPVGTEMGPTVQAQALTQGARAEIDRIVGTNLNDRAALNSLVKGEGDWNYDRLSTLFGKEKTDRIYKVLENERNMASTENLALSNSKTKALTDAQKEINPQPGGPGVAQSLGDFKPGTAAVRLKDRLLGGIADRRQSSQNSSIADIIMGNGPLKANVVGKTRGAGPITAEALNEVIMRPDVNPAPNAVDRERLRRMQADKVY